MKKQNGKTDKYVFDSSAFFTLFDDEDGVEIVQNLLEKAQKGRITVFCSFASYTEVFYVTYQEKGEEEAKRRINSMSKLNITYMDSSKELGLIAGRLKAIHKISFANTWVAATAIMMGAILVHKDPEFEGLKDELEMLTLPYQTSKDKK